MLEYLLRHHCFYFQILLGDLGKKSQSSLHFRLCTSFLPSAKHRLCDNLARTVWCTPCIAGLLQLNLIRFGQEGVRVQHSFKYGCVFFITLTVGLHLPLEKGAPVRRSSLPTWGHTNILQLSFSKPFGLGCVLHEYTPSFLRWRCHSRENNTSQKPYKIRKKKMTLCEEG